MKFNINHTVRVKLTPYGRYVHQTDHDAFWLAAGRSMDYTPPKEDAGGWSEWQLWVLIASFGPHMRMGCSPPFETEIELVERAEVTAQAPDPMDVVRSMCANPAGVDLQR